MDARIPHGRIGAGGDGSAERRQRQRGRRDRGPHEPARLRDHAAPERTPARVRWPPASGGPCGSSSRTWGSATRTSPSPPRAPTLPAAISREPRGPWPAAAAVAGGARPPAVDRQRHPCHRALDAPGPRAPAAATWQPDVHAHDHAAPCRQARHRSASPAAPGPRARAGDAHGPLGASNRASPDAALLLSTHAIARIREACSVVPTAMAPPLFSRLVLALPPAVFVTALLASDAVAGKTPPARPARPPMKRLLLAVPPAVFLAALVAADAFAGSQPQHVQLTRR